MFFAFQTYNFSRVAEVVINISRGEAVLGQHVTACFALHQLALSTLGYALSLDPPKGYQLLIFSTRTANLSAGMCVFVCLMLRLLETRACLSTCLAEDILKTVKKVIDIFPIVLRLLFVLAAACARDQLAALAAVCARSELGLRLPPSAPCT